MYNLKAPIKIINPFIYDFSPFFNSSRKIKLFYLKIKNYSVTINENKYAYLYNNDHITVIC